LLDGRRRLPAWGFCCLLGRWRWPGRAGFNMEAGDILLRRLTFLSLTVSRIANPRLGRRGILSSHRGRLGEILPGIRLQAGLRRDMDPDMDRGMGRRVLPIRCGLRRRRGICRSGWRSTRTCL
jgi:hypothetical protein